MFASNSTYSLPPRILVVDDIADNRDFLQLLLESEGYEVETAAEGYSAIAKIDRNPPDLVLLDLMMPDLDGQSVAQWLTQNYASIPILVVTGYPDLPDICRESKSIADCIRKPIAFDELLEKVKTFITASKQRRRLNQDLDFN